MTSDIITQYFPDLSDLQKEQFSKLDELYTFWNAQINVISRKDIDKLYLHHILHSLAIAKVISFLPGEKILDVGTGGGFPGIPLAIAFPHVQLNMVNSIRKKLKEVNKILSIKESEIDNCVACQKDLILLKEKIQMLVL